jgi:hypothetical protein
MIDGPVAQLVLDLEERGLLNRTLIVMQANSAATWITEGKPDRTVKDQVIVPDRMTELKLRAATRARARRNQRGRRG